MINSIKGRSLIKGKKGDITDPLIFLVTIFVFAVILSVIIFLVPQIFGGLEDAGLNNTAEARSSIETMKSFGSTTLQNGFFLLVIGLIMATLISSFLVDRHPIFLFLYILILGITVFVGVYLANAYDTLRNTDALSGVLATQGLMNSVMDNLIVIIIGMGVLSIVITFSRFRGAGRGGDSL